MILHMRHTLWTGISETNVNFITSATRIHAFNNNNYVIWTFHVLSLYIMFLSHLLFLCVAVYLSPLLSSLAISSLFFFSNCNFNYERERAFEIHVKRSRTVKIEFRLPSHIHHTHPINTTNRGEFVILVDNGKIWGTFTNAAFLSSWRHQFSIQTQVP